MQAKKTEPVLMKGFSDLALRRSLSTANEAIKLSGGSLDPEALKMEDNENSVLDPQKRHKLLVLQKKSSELTDRVLNSSMEERSPDREKSSRSKKR